jgi:hypothetical protein
MKHKSIYFGKPCKVQVSEFSESMQKIKKGCKIVLFLVKKYFLVYTKEHV